MSLRHLVAWLEDPVPPVYSANSPDAYDAYCRKHNFNLTEAIAAVGPTTRVTITHNGAKITGYILGLYTAVLFDRIQAAAHVDTKFQLVAQISPVVVKRLVAAGVPTRTANVILGHLATHVMQLQSIDQTAHLEACSEIIDLDVAINGCRTLVAQRVNRWFDTVRVVDAITVGSGI